MEINFSRRIQLQEDPFGERSERVHMHSLHVGGRLTEGTWKLEFFRDSDPNSSSTNPVHRYRLDLVVLPPKPEMDSDPVRSAARADEIVRRIFRFVGVERMPMEDPYERVERGGKKIFCSFHSFRCMLGKMCFEGDFSFRSFVCHGFCMFEGLLRSRTSPTRGRPHRSPKRRRRLNRRELRWLSWDLQTINF